MVEMSGVIAEFTTRVVNNHRGSKMSEYEVSIGVSKTIEAGSQDEAKAKFLEWLVENQDHIAADERRTVFKRG
jgi:hypothetical protein